MASAMREDALIPDREPQLFHPWCQSEVEASLDGQNGCHTWTHAAREVTCYGCTQIICFGHVARVVEDPWLCGEFSAKPRKVRSKQAQVASEIECDKRKNTER